MRKYGTWFCNLEREKEAWPLSSLFKLWHDIWCLVVGFSRRLIQRKKQLT